MKYYKDTKTGEVYAYESDGSQDDYINPGLVLMTPSEADTHLNPPAEPHYKTQFSVLEFRDRFTIDEQLVIRQAQFDDMEVGLVYDNFQAAQFIDVEDPRVEQGIDLYVVKELLDPERKAQLLQPTLVS